MNSLLKLVFDKIKNKVDEDCIDGNIGASERILSVISGGLIFGIGLKRVVKHPFTALSAISLGGTLVYRGVTGHCTIKRIMEKVSDEPEVTVIEHRYFVK
ncbi:MAG TPA: DUF2892 domain-containing protein [Sphingobacterium sp.]|nr:DUF2892 domain-containing protein [Sphingobacterium sp.]